MIERRTCHLDAPRVPDPIPALVDPAVEEIREEIQDHVHHANGNENTVSAFIYEDLNELRVKLSHTVGALTKRLQRSER